MSIKKQILLATIFAPLCFAQGPVGGVQGISPPANQMDSTLISNGNFNGSTDWVLGSCASYDSTTTHTADGSGSMKLSSCGSGIVADFHYKPGSYAGFTVGSTGRFIVRLWAQPDANIPSSGVGLALQIMANAGNGSGGCSMWRTSGQIGEVANDYYISPLYPSTTTTGPWVQMAWECGVDPVIFGGTYIYLGIETYGETSGNIWVDDIDVEDVWYPIQTFLLYPNYRGYLWSDRTPVTLPQLQTCTRGSNGACSSGGWPYGTPVTGEVMGVSELAASSGYTLSSGTLTVKMGTGTETGTAGSGCSSSTLSTKTYSSPNAIQFWHFLPSDYGTLTIGNTYYLCSSYTDTGGTYTFPDWAVVYENAAFRTGLLNWVDVDQTVVHNGTKVLWNSAIDRTTGGYSTGSGSAIYSSGTSCTPNQSSAKNCYVYAMQGPCAGTLSGSVCSGNPSSLPAAQEDTGTSYTGGPARIPLEQYLGFNNMSAPLSTLVSCNPTSGSDQCGPYFDAGWQYGFTSNLYSDTNYGSPVAETGTGTAPNFSPTVTTTSGSISANYLFLEAVPVEAGSSIGTEGLAVLYGLPSSPVTVNLSSATCAGTNCGVSFTLPGCVTNSGSVTARIMGWLLYTATGSTSTPPANSSFQWQPQAFTTFANGQLAAGTAIPCGTSISLTSLLATGNPPPTVEGGLIGRQTWAGNSASDQTVWTDLATEMTGHTGAAAMYVSDEAWPLSIGNIFRQIQTVSAQANGLFTWGLNGNDDYSLAQFRTVMDIVGSDPETNYGSGFPYPENYWAVPKSWSANPQCNTYKYFIVSSISESGTTVTATISPSLPSGFGIGSLFTIYSVSPSGFNQTNGSVTGVSGNSFTYTAASGLGTGSGGVFLWTNQVLPVECFPTAIDVVGSIPGKYTYGARPCLVSIGDSYGAGHAGLGYAEIRRSELKGFTACQNWGIQNAMLTRWVFGDNGIETDVWYGNTQHMADYVAWHNFFEGLYPILIQPVKDSSQIGIGNVLSGVSVSTTAANDCGTGSGYTNTSNFPFGQIRFVTHQDSSSNKIIILANNLCYGSPTVTFSGTFNHATSVTAQGDPSSTYPDSPNNYTLSISSGSFSDTFSPLEQKVYQIAGNAPSAGVTVMSGAKCNGCTIH